MREIEVKMHIDNRKELSDAVVADGFILEKETAQHDQLFVESGMDYDDVITKNLPVIRVRTENSSITMTGKVRVGDGGLDKIEKEIVVDNADEAMGLIEMMGFAKVLELRKERKQYTKDALTICVDHVKELGDFVEIEQLVKEDDVIDAEKVTEELLTKLLNYGAKEKDRAYQGYDVLMYEKNKDETQN